MMRSLLVLFALVAPALAANGDGTALCASLDAADATAATIQTAIQGYNGWTVTEITDELTTCIGANGAGLLTKVWSNQSAMSAYANLAIARAAIAALTGDTLTASNLSAEQQTAIGGAAITTALQQVGAGAVSMMICARTAQADMETDLTTLVGGSSPLMNVADKGALVIGSGVMHCAETGTCSGGTNCIAASSTALTGDATRESVCIAAKKTDGTTACDYAAKAATIKLATTAVLGAMAADADAGLRGALMRINGGDGVALCATLNAADATATTVATAVGAYATALWTDAQMTSEITTCAATVTTLAKYVILEQARLAAIGADSALPAEWKTALDTTTLQGTMSALGSGIIKTGLCAGTTTEEMTTYLNTLIAADSVLATGLTDKGAAVIQAGISACVNDAATDETKDGLISAAITAVIAAATNLSTAMNDALVAARHVANTAAVQGVNIAIITAVLYALM